MFFVHCISRWSSLPFFSPFTFYYMLKHETNSFFIYPNRVWQHVVCMGLDKNNIPDEYLCEVCKPRPIDRKRAKAMQVKINSSNHNMYIIWRPSFTIFFCSDTYHFAIFRPDVAMKFANSTIQVQATANMQTNVGIQKSQNLAKKRQMRRHQPLRPLLLKKVRKPNKIQK